YKFDLDPVGTLALVQEDRRRSLHIVDDHVHAAVAVQVGKSSSPRDPRSPCQRLFADLSKLTLAGLHEKLAALGVSLPEAFAFDFRIYVAVGDEQFQNAVIVEVDEPRSPFHEIPDRFGEPGLHGDVTESHLAVVMIERAGIINEVGNEYVGPPIAIVV